jgi:hypothetical protein
MCAEVLKIFRAVLLIVVLTTKSVTAAEIIDRYMSVRAAGMGNAYAPLATGIDSLFYNPSGLAGNRLELRPLEFRAGVNGIDSYQDALDFKDDVSGTIRKFYGKTINVGVGATTGLALPNFAVAGYDSANVSADLSNPALPSFHVDAVNDYGAAAGFGFDLIPHFMKWGVAFKKIYRMGGSMDLPVSALATLDDQTIKDQLLNYGNGYSMDTGFTLTFPAPVQPSFTFVWKDIGNTSFTKTKGIFDVPTDKSNMVGAISLDIGFPGLKLIPVIQADYLNDSSIPLDMKMNAGVELQLLGFSFRGGLHQGYYTAGFGMDMLFMTLDVATYGVELGEYPGQREDRRYVLALTFDLDYEAGSGSSFLGLSPENRKGLKQRR